MTIHLRSGRNVDRTPPVIQQTRERQQRRTDGAAAEATSRKQTPKSRSPSSTHRQSAPGKLRKRSSSSRQTPKNQIAPPQRNRQRQTTEMEEDHESGEDEERTNGLTVNVDVEFNVGDAASANISEVSITVAEANVNLDLPAETNASADAEVKVAQAKLKFDVPEANNGRQTDAAASRSRPSSVEPASRRASRYKKTKSASRSKLRSQKQEPKSRSRSKAPRRWSRKELPRSTSQNSTSRSRKSTSQLPPLSRTSEKLQQRRGQGDERKGGRGGERKGGRSGERRERRVEQRQIPRQLDFDDSGVEDGEQTVLDRTIRRVTAPLVRRTPYNSSHRQETNRHPVSWSEISQLTASNRTDDEERRFGFLQPTDVVVAKTDYDKQQRQQKPALLGTKPRENASAPPEQPKSHPITGINKTLLSFIAAKSMRNPLGPFHEGGPEHRELKRMMDESLEKRLKECAETHKGGEPAGAPQSRNGQRATESMLIRDRTDRAKPRQHRLEVIGEFREVLVDGRTVWRARKSR